MWVNKTDLQGVFDFGFDISLAERLMMNISLRFRGSINDINNEKWQFKDSCEIEYNTSRNLCAGLNLGLLYQLRYWHH